MQQAAPRNFHVDAAQMWVQNAVQPDIHGTISFVSAKFLDFLERARPECQFA
jgi:hypothetical protein